MVPGNYIKESFNNPYTGSPEFTWQGSNDPSVGNGEKAAMKDPSDSNLRVFPGPDVWWYNQPSTNLINQGNPISSAGNFRVGYYESQIDSTNIPIPPHTHAIYTTTYQGGDDCAWNNNSAGGRMGGNDIGRAVRNSTQNGGKGARVQGCVAHEVLSVGGGTPPDTVDISTITPYYGVFIWKRVK